MNEDVPDSTMISLYHRGFSQTIVDTCLWMLYLILFPLSLRSLFRHRVWTRATIYLGITTLVMFIVTNIYFFVYLRLQTSIVEVMLTTNGGKFTNRERLGFAKDGIQGSRVIQALPRLINFILGDGVVVHRAFVIAGVQSADHPRRVLSLRITMMLLLLTSIGFSFYDGYLSILLGTQSLQFALTGRSNVIPDITAITLSFSTNFIATIAIALTTQPQLRPVFVTVSPRNTSNTASKAFHQVVHLLILLTETAVFYCILQFVAILCLAIPAKLGNQPDIGTAAYLSAINYLSALYPTVLIIIFSRQSKRRDSFDARTSNHEAQYEQKRSGEGVHGETLTFPSQMGDQRNTHVSWEPDEWQKARGSYTNFVV